MAPRRLPHVFTCGVAAVDFYVPISLPLLTMSETLGAFEEVPGEEDTARARSCPLRARAAAKQLALLF